MALLQPISTEPEERPTRNVVATKLTLGPGDKMGRHRLGELKGIEPPSPIGPLAFLIGASMMDAYQTPID